jgi:hypothetical protein
LPWREGRTADGVHVCVVHGVGGSSYVEQAIVTFHKHNTHTHTHTQRGRASHSTGGSSRFRTEWLVKHFKSGRVVQRSLQRQDLHRLLPRPYESFLPFFSSLLLLRGLPVPCPSEQSISHLQTKTVIENREKNSWGRGRCGRADPSTAAGQDGKLLAWGNTQVLVPPDGRLLPTPRTAGPVRVQHGGASLAYFGQPG